MANVSNRNPVILVDHKLGIEAWAVKVVYMHAYSRLMQLKRNGNSNNAAMGSLSRIVLLIVADCATAWNVR